MQYVDMRCKELWVKKSISLGFPGIDRMGYYWQLEFNFAPSFSQRLEGSLRQLKAILRH